MTPEMQAETRLPDAVRQYHSLYPLEDPRAADEAGSKAFGVQSLVLKGISAHDGQAYALRRISRRQARAFHADTEIPGRRVHLLPATGFAVPAVRLPI